MTRHRIAQIGENRNPKSPENRFQTRRFLRKRLLQPPRSATLLNDLAVLHGRLLGERGLDISYESVRSWVLKFGPMIARNLRRCHPRPSDRWHLGEMVERIAGKHMYLWRRDHEGKVLEILVQRRWDKCAAVSSCAICSASRASHRRG